MADDISTKKLLQLKNCDLTLGSTKVLNKINMDINEGEFVSIIGPSGCGKSTTLRIISELLTPDINDGKSGLVLSGQPLRTSMAFQKPALLPWLTVQENIEMSLSLGPNQLPNSLRRSKADYVLALVDLSPFSKHYPKQLSGGMQQRAALARALAAEPEMLLMDEPFGALDEMTKEILNKELLKLWEDKTNGIKSIVMVTHSLHEAVSFSDKVIVLSARPATVKKIINISIKEPRSEILPYVSEFEEYKRSILAIRKELYSND